MKKKILAFVLAAIMILGFMPQTAKADETYPNPVTVYLSLTDDGGFLTDTAGKAIALREISVPYFDLGVNYGLSDFYFNTTSYGNSNPDNPWSHTSNLEPGTQQNALGKVTLLHLLIYAMEVYQLGIDPSLAGQGQLKPYMQLVDQYDSTKSFNATAGDTMIKISGTPGSIYFENYWNMDTIGSVPDNWMYFRNYSYPLASTAWGATADQILLSTDDIITMGHFAIYGMYNYGASVFGFAKPANGNIERGLVVDIGDEVDLQFYHASADMFGTYATTQTAFSESLPVYCFSINNTVSGPVSTSINWTYLDDTDSSGAITIDTSGWDSGVYMITIPGLTDNDFYIEEHVYGYVCTPGGIILEVE